MVANSGSYHNIIRHIVLLISQFSDIVQKSLCTSDGAMVPTFQMNEPFSMFVARTSPPSARVAAIRFMLQNNCKTKLH